MSLSKKNFFITQLKPFFWTLNLISFTFISPFFMAETSKKNIKLSKSKTKSQILLKW